MHWTEALKLALQSLWVNKLRTVLTLLGVVIGVAAVISVVTLVNGANAYVDAKLNTYGSDVFTVSKMPNLITSFAEYTKYQKRRNVTSEDFRMVEAGCKRCKLVGAGQGSQVSVKSGTDSVTSVSLRGWTARMPELNNINITEGRIFTPTEVEHGARVAVVGTDIQENLLKGDDPINKEIRVDGVPYTIIGMGEKQGKTLGNSQDNYVIVPLTTYQHTYGSSKTLTIYVKGPGAGAALEETGDEVRSMMRNARHDRLGEDDSFTLDLNNTFLSLFKTVTGLFGAIAIPVAAISLVVGGIVIMNIMLVSVTERTREIGVRKALGARRRDILLQFVIESGLMATAGGIIGVLFGVGVGFGISTFAGFPMSIAWWSVVAGLFVSTGVGVFFGVYPARQAAMLDPITALRSD
ncbi:ABC transporter permease [Terriglobus roseus]|uniref:Putative ABC transport system permease protein n=1 Tax=Terriglobus roseus TaxID=392734 RepID=A0A1H4MQM1_9BACT|nr:ABC transporter permease [Terriglobus roseus]SEB85341.1 putative ABC transport system permease protein [Terriglobus roseus]